MSDLSKVPEGATHYCDSDGCSPVYYKVGLGWAVFTEGFGWRDSNNEAAWFVKNCKPINSWTIYNNTKPLRELTNEQRGLLFNHWCNGGAAQIFNGEEWCDVLDSCNLINRKYAYRAKQKSEQELFIDLATEIASDECETERIKESVDAFIIKLFKAGFKAPLQTKEG